MHDPPRGSLAKRIDITHRSFSPRLLPWSLEFILNSELRIKYAETVPFPKFNYSYRLIDLR